MTTTYRGGTRHAAPSAKASDHTSARISATPVERNGDDHTSEHAPAVRNTDDAAFAVSVEGKKDSAGQRLDDSPPCAQCAMKGKRPKSEDDNDDDKGVGGGSAGS